MKNKLNSIELKKSIQILEEEQSVKEELLREQFYLTYESLKPVNLLKNTVKEIISSPSLIENALSTTAGLVAGYISKRLIMGSKATFLKSFIGPIVQLGMANIVAKNPNVHKFIGQFLKKKVDNQKNEQELEQ